MARQVCSDRSASAQKDDVIQIGAVAELKTTLNQHTFFLDAEQHELFLATLDAPPSPSSQLKRLMQREPLWNR
ncbi:antitoxin [Sphingobium sp. C100]|uniref:type II toxin -antitoxin system TacA 1-like antitoxin n=1 Tax=Sphingobium sp. C100 TaxID=1207055 RepID=UPI0003D59ED9|nr:DUF1778 domain-containing protein [Sphingobium sp. C100]ETI64029.1 antitoxin [Sphingobium sp. C100]